MYFVYVLYMYLLHMDRGPSIHMRILYVCLYIYHVYVCCFLDPLLTFLTCSRASPTGLHCLSLQQTSKSDFLSAEQLAGF